MNRRAFSILFAVAGMALTGVSIQAQVAVRAKKLYTMSGPPISDGVVIVRNGKIAAVGEAADVKIPDGFRVLEAAVVTPGLIDAHSVVGLTGQFNQRHDQDQLERSSPMQPELRAVDAYNAHERLVGWVRSFGVTTVHTGHAPGELISGQTIVVKTAGNTVEAALVVETAAVAVTLGPSSTKQGKSPGTRGKQAAMLRTKLGQARDYLRKRSNGGPDGEGRPPRDLGLEVLSRVLNKEVPLLVTTQRAQDIATALRLMREFDVRVWLDGAAESYRLVDEIKAAGVPVILHPGMARANGELQNASFETAAKLRKAGIRVAMQSGYEGYVPKTRVVLFEAAMAAANGLSFEETLATITIDAARILGIDQRVGSIAAGKDGDLALYDGDPFEYTTHCIGTIVEGEVVHDGKR